MTNKNEQPFEEVMFGKIKTLCKLHGALIFDLSYFNGEFVVEIALDEHISTDLELGLKELGVEVVRI